MNIMTIMICLNWIFAGLVVVFSQAVYADAMPKAYDFFQSLEQQDLFSKAIDDQYKLEVEFNDMHKHPYVGEDQLDSSLSVINHDFYENDRLRFYNQTRYDISDFKNKYVQGGLADLSLSDISFSLGYGMEYKFSSTYSAGYEYLSSFPNNNTQSIRVFWKRIF